MDLASGTIKDVDGNTVEFWYRQQRTVSQAIRIEQLTDKHGGGQTATLMAAFLVLALNADGSRLYPDADFLNLSNKLPHDELIRACIQMGGVREDTDPKKS